jgi:hypothetical protein
MSLGYVNITWMIVQNNTGLQKTIYCSGIMTFSKKNSTQLVSIVEVVKC